MSKIDYSALPHPVRDDLVDAQRLAWTRIAEPGDWLDGARRVAVAAETRNAWSCDLCQARKDALSPFAVDGSHDSVAALSPTEIEVVHRISTDPGRLSEDWVKQALNAGLSEEEYIEIVSIICMVSIIDAFARGVGVALFPLPEPVSGEIAGYRAPGAKQYDAWISYVTPEDAVDSDGLLYDGPNTAPVITALSLVPSAKRAYWELGDEHYMPGTRVFDWDLDLRAIDRSQMELVASRVSALHQCVY